MDTMKYSMPVFCSIQERYNGNDHYATAWTTVSLYPSFRGQRNTVLPSVTIEQVFTQTSYPTELRLLSVTICRIIYNPIVVFYRAENFLSTKNRRENCYSDTPDFLLHLYVKDFPKILQVLFRLKPKRNWRKIRESCQTRYLSKYHQLKLLIFIFYKKVESRYVFFVSSTKRNLEDRETSNYFLN